MLYIAPIPKNRITDGIQFYLLRKINEQEKDVIFLRVLTFLCTLLFFVVHTTYKSPFMMIDVASFFFKAFLMKYIVLLQHIGTNSSQFYFET